MLRCKRLSAPLLPRLVREGKSAERTLRSRDASLVTLLLRLIRRPEGRIPLSAHSGRMGRGRARTRFALLRLAALPGRGSGLLRYSERRQSGSVQLPSLLQSLLLLELA